MKFVFAFAFLFCLTASHCQLVSERASILPERMTFRHIAKSELTPKMMRTEKIRIMQFEKWKFNSNKIWTGALVMLSGAAKGLNETLEFNWHGFAAVFPRANPKWFWPQQSFKNKYKDGDPSKGSKFPLSTSALVFLTDQYHLDNFIQRGALTAALVIKIGDGKKPFRHYLFDALYYTATYQLGFGSVYYYFKSRM
ncbi:MAG: hypothetical protein HZB42_04610 [Sphingobacteriales bacterium]|nr:hypothetical protein [Sphingobacteriales bacterium]